MKYALRTLYKEKRMLAQEHLRITELLLLESFEDSTKEALELINERLKELNAAIKLIQDALNL